MVAVHPLCALSARQIRDIGKQLTDETAEVSRSRPQPAAIDAAM
jgi:hypothetical protein